MSVLITLDTLASATIDHIREWTPDLMRNRAPFVLKHLLGKWFIRWPDNIFKGGNPFHAKVRCSHKALGAAVKAGREWVCEISGRLVDEGWITTKAPRLPNGQQEVTSYGPGWRLKKLLVRLVKSKQRSQKNRVADSQQKLPTKEERMKNRDLFAGLIAEVGQKLAMNKTKKQ